MQGACVQRWRRNALLQLKRCVVELGAQLIIRCSLMLFQTTRGALRLILICMCRLEARTERSNGTARQSSSSSSFEALQKRIEELCAQLVESERNLSAVKRERNEHKIHAAGASVSELEAHKSKAELAKDKEALHDALQVRCFWSCLCSVPCHSQERVILSI